MDENTKLAGRLAKVYGRLLGEREWLLAPPKYLTRLKADRTAFQTAAPERQRRLADIEMALSHFAPVIAMLDPALDLTSVRPIKPKSQHRVPLPNGIAGTAMDILRETGDTLTPAEIVRVMGERYGLDLSTVQERQRYYDAINQAFAGTYREHLIEHPGELPDNPGYRRRWSWRYV